MTRNNLGFRVPITDYVMKIEEFGRNWFETNVSLFLIFLSFFSEFEYRTQNNHDEKFVGMFLPIGKK